MALSHDLVNHKKCSWLKIDARNGIGKNVNLEATDSYVKYFYSDFNASEIY